MSEARYYLEDNSEWPHIKVKQYVIVDDGTTYLIITAKFEDGNAAWAGHVVASPELLEDPDFPAGATFRKLIIDGLKDAGPPPIRRR